MLMSEVWAELALPLIGHDGRTGPGGHENRRAHPTPRQLQYLGEWSLHTGDIVGELALRIQG